MDLKTALNIDPDQLSESEKDDIAQVIVKEDFEKWASENDLRNALRLFQGVLSFKSEQVMSLGLELDELAAKQGQEEANLMQEIEELREQISKNTKGYIHSGADSEGELRQLLHASELNTQKLMAEVQAQEQENLSYKVEIEKLESQLATLENDRLQLKRELLAMREEIQDQPKEVEVESQEPKKKNRQLIESLRQKNKHLSLLLNDVEASEKENIVLKEKLTNVKIELAEATKNIVHTTGELVALQIGKEEQAEKARQLEQMCKALHQQVTELVNEKEKRDSELETFQREIDVRVQEWKEIVATKEKQLADLREQVAQQNLKGQYLLKNCESDHVALLSQTLQKRESQIDELQTQLSQATKDLNESTLLLENMHRVSELSHVGPYLQDAEATQKQLSAAEERISFLEEKLADAERDADGKSEEITKLIIQLRSYEAGEFGLSEALVQIKDLSQQRSVRDKHIEQLVQTANQLRGTCDALQEENLTLREQLNISPEEFIQTSATVLKNKEDNVIKVHQQQIDRLEEDLISARMEKRILTQQVLTFSNQLEKYSKHPPEPETQKPNGKQQQRSQADARVAARKIRALQQEQQQLQIERQSLVEENEALRQGLHDILDSVHNQDGQSSVRLESKVLEHLLHALDSRHISGWYHPAMRIQAKVNAVEGNNEALREQIHCLRQEESKAQNELQTAKMRILELEGIIGETEIAPLSEKLIKLEHQTSKLDATTTLHNLPTEISSQGLDMISKMNKHLIRVLHEHHVEKEQVAETLDIQRELHHQLDALVLQMAQAVQQQSVEKEKWLEEKHKLEEQIDSLQASVVASEAHVSELKVLWDTLSIKDEINKEIVKDVYCLATLSAEKQRFERIAKAAQNRSDHAKRQLQIIKAEWNTNKQWLMRQFGDLLQFKRNSLLRMSDLESLLANSVSLRSLEAANKQVGELTVKYNELLRQHEMTVSVSNKEVKRLMSELKLERELKHDLAIKVAELSKRFWVRNTDNGTSEQELSVKLAQAEGEAIRERVHASHAEKMCQIIKEEIAEVTRRCLALEQEVTALLSTNHNLKIEISSLRETSLVVNYKEEKDDLQSQLAAAKAEVLESQTAQKYTQQLSDISQAQVQMLDQLHDRSELQLDSLRQVLYKLQGETEIGSELVCLSEELSSCQVSEVAAWSRVSTLEKKCDELLFVNEKQSRDIEELQSQMIVDKTRYNEQYRKVQEELLTVHRSSECTLPLSFFHFVVTAFTQRSAECRDLWHLLQECEMKLASQLANAEEKKAVCQQSLELQNALQADHSDFGCQHLIESWATQLTELKIKDLKSSRRCEAMESMLKQTQERLESEETLLSSLERQLLALDIKVTQTSTISEKDMLQGSANQLMQGQDEDKLCDVLVPQISEANSSNDMKESVPKQSPKKTEALIAEAAARDQIKSLTEEIDRLNDCLEKKKIELESCRALCTELKQSLSEKDSVQQSESVIDTRVDFTPSVIIVPSKDKDNCETDKAVLQATVESLQNIINQKEDTISRYQNFLQDVREEDARIISALQEHLQTQQVNFTAQEQAYVRLKISMRHLSLEASGESATKASLDVQLTRSNELEDEVTLLKTRVIALSSDLQRCQQDAVHWKSTAQQHLSTIGELNASLSEQKSSEKRSLFGSPYHETSILTSSRSNKNEQDKQEAFKGCRDSEIGTKIKLNQVQIQLSSEITELRNKIRQMEEREHQSKNEIQRLRDQIPIYSRRLLQSQSGPILPEREAALLKRVKYLEQQLEQQKADHQESLLQELKKVKSVENVARWDERKKHQLQIERLKASLQEQAEETALLHDKVERMHNTVHRLEREKIALEHRVRSLHHIEQDKMILEERLKNLERNEIQQCMMDELQKDRDSLFAEVQVLRAKETLVSKNMLDELMQERDKLYGEVSILRKREAVTHLDQKKNYTTNAAHKERASLLKGNLELECENLELKLELEKLRSETPCLRHKVAHLERLLHETRGLIHKQSAGGNRSIPDPLIMENKTLQEMVKQLSEQLEVASHNLKLSDHSRVAALESELNQKSLLLNKVKSLLERAAMKERELSLQVSKLEAELEK